jgi:hypothetical protein
MPTRREFPLDRSAMFSALLELSPKYGKLDSRVGERITTEALAAWRDSTGDDMFRFAKEWIKTERKDLLPLHTGRPWSNRP